MPSIQTITTTCSCCGAGVTLFQELPGSGFFSWPRHWGVVPGATYERLCPRSHTVVSREVLNALLGANQAAALSRGFDPGLKVLASTDLAVVS